MNDDRVRGGMWGLLVGDAAGVPYEFMSAGGIRRVAAGAPYADLDSRIPLELRQHKVLPGTWSDDGAMALATADSIATLGRVDTRDIGARFLRWRYQGDYTPDGNVFDVGAMTARSLAALKGGEPGRPAGESGLGNGSLMRILPLALWHAGSDWELVQNARAISAITHPHPVAGDACAIYCLLVRHVASVAMRGEVVTTAEAARVMSIFERMVQRRGIGLREPAGSGFVIDSLSFAMIASTMRSYSSTVREAIALGVDTDTTAAIGGGLVGARDGMGAIPGGWLASMRGAELARGIIERLVRSRL